MENEFEKKNFSIKSNYFMSFNSNKFSQIQIKINQYKNEIKQDLLILRKEKYFNYNLKSKVLSYRLLNNSNLQKQIKKKNYNNHKGNKSEDQLNIRKQFKYKDIILSERLKKIKNEIIKFDNKSFERSSRNKNKLKYCKSQEDIFITKNKLIKQINDIKEKSFQTNQNLLKNNNNQKFIKKMNLVLKKDINILYNFDQFFKSEINNPFDINIKNNRNSIYSNIDNILNKLKENNKISIIKSYDMNERQKRKEIQNKKFDKFEKLINHFKLLRKRINKID